METLVKSLGLTARTFASAESYLQSSWVKKTHCLITDVQMPNMSGLELQERLSHLGFDIPIIFITAYPDEAVRTKAINAGPSASCKNRSTFRAHAWPTVCRRHWAGPR